MADTKNRIPHRYRKNPGQAERYALLRQKANAARPKQRWNGQTKSWDGR